MAIATRIHITGGYSVQPTNDVVIAYIQSIVTAFNLSFLGDLVIRENGNGHLLSQPLSNGMIFVHTQDNVQLEIIVNDSLNSKLFASLSQSGLGLINPTIDENRLLI